MHIEELTVLLERYHAQVNETQKELKRIARELKAIKEALQSIASRKK